MLEKLFIIGNLSVLDTLTCNRLKDLYSENVQLQDEFEFKPDFDKGILFFDGKLRNSSSDGVPVRRILKPSLPTQVQDIKALFELSIVLESLTFVPSGSNNGKSITCTTIESTKYYFETIKSLPQI